MHEKPTSFDIAFLAGVSQPTVSRALRGSPVVSLETRKRIEEIARQLNYRVDKNASNLRSQHSNTLALLLFEDPTADNSQINPFFLSMLGSITRASASRGYDLLISFQQLSSDFCQDYEDSRKADGIILLGYGDYEEYRPRLEQLVSQGTHFVRWGPVLTDEPGVSVGSDNAQGGFDVTRHLLAQDAAVRIRGTVERIEGPVYVVKNRDGAELKLTLTDNPLFVVIIPSKMTDIKQGMFVGSAGMMQADGVQKAIEVHIFPESMRGTGEGHYDWDLLPKSKMTNANVEQAVNSVDGQVLSVKYKDGEKKLLVTPETVVVTYEFGKREEVQPGTRIFVSAAKKQPDGTVQTPRITYGRNGQGPAF
jgi:transcriptional regulator with XRE-family HTH domain